MEAIVPAQQPKPHFVREFSRVRNVPPHDEVEMAKRRDDKRLNPNVGTIKILAVGEAGIHEATKGISGSFLISWLPASK